MTKAAPLKNDFSGGELGDFVHGRVDSDRYGAGVALCLNFIPTLQGPITRRVGTFFVTPLKDCSKRGRLFRFVFSKFKAYLLIFENLLMRVVKNDNLVTFTPKNITAATQANPVQITSNAHGYSNGDRVTFAGVGGMLQLNLREFRVAGAAANTFTLQDAQTGAAVDGTAFGAYTSGGTVAKIFEMAHPYSDAELPDVQVSQSNDVIYCTHPDHPPQKIVHASDTSWSCTQIAFTDGPYLDMNTTAIMLNPAATGPGSVVVTASASLFASTDIGRSIRILHTGSWGWGVITFFTSATQVTVSVTRAWGGSGSGVTTWRLGVWSNTTGFPTTSGFFQTRMVYGGADFLPNREDLSVVNSFEDFTPTAANGAVSDSNAIAVVQDSNEVNGTEWLVPTDRGMAVGTTGGEVLVAPNSQLAAITPTDVTAKQLTFYGSAPIPPARAGRSILYFKGGARRLLEMAFFIESDGFQSADLSTLNEDATLSGVREVAYTRESQPILWCVREDGVLAAVTFARDADALRVAWHRHVLGGVSTAGGDPAVVESVATIPDPTGTYDEVCLIVRRLINGRTVRTVEVMDRAFDKTVWAHDAFFVDCGLSLDSSVAITAVTNGNPVVVTTGSAHGFANGDDVFITETSGFLNGDDVSQLNGRHFTAANVTGTTLELKQGVPAANLDGGSFTPYGQGGKIAKRVTSVSGLSHLEGQTVAVLGDGGVQASRVVTGGAITLQYPAAFVHVGLPYNSDIQLLPFEAGAPDGTAEGKLKKMERIMFRLYRTASLKYGQAFDETMRPLEFRVATDDAGVAAPIFTGPKSVAGGQRYDLEAKLCIRVDEPLPATILSIAPRMTVETKG